MEKPKNNEVVKQSKWDILYIWLSFLVWGVYISLLAILNGVWSAIGILGLGGALLVSGIKIGRYKERLEAAEKKQDEDEAENQQDAVEQVKCY